MDLAYRTPTPGRRFGLLLTVLVHLALLMGWQAMRKLPAPAPVQDGPRTRVLWIPLPLPQPAPLKEEPVPAPAPRETAAPRPQLRPAPAPVAPQAIQVIPAAPTTAPADTSAAPADPAAAPSARQILERARRDIGRIDKALRKENNPYIAAPLDSPQIRMRRKMEEAAALAKPGLFEAPKVEDLVNDTGDGARRSRVITGNGTYCITDRAPTTSIDMIEKHGKQRITSCPQHELPASKQEWRTLRD